MTLKQYWSRVRNVHTYLSTNSLKGKQARQEMLRRTNNGKFSEANFLRNYKKGKIYSVREVAHIVSKVEKQKRLFLWSRWKRLRKEGDTKLTFAQFRKTNKHIVDTEFESMSALYNSP